MSDKPKIQTIRTLKKLVDRLRDDLRNNDGGKNFVLLFAYNGTGKTRLSMAFKEVGKKKRNQQRDTLYFNAYTEDLFTWDNDLEGDSQRALGLNSKSRFFAGLEDLDMDNRIRPFLHRYADFDFTIDYTKWKVNFFRKIQVDGREKTFENIKVSRGEENIFIWCFFLAIVELAIDGAESYNWVKFLYIDDPISSLDDNNSIALASDLALLLRKGKGSLKAVISSHHTLFFNVMCNELKEDTKKYFLDREKIPTTNSPQISEDENLAKRRNIVDDGYQYKLQTTDDTPFFHHVAMLSELQTALESKKLYTYHFNVLRSILEKTATFFGYADFSVCIGIEDKDLFARALNLLSHGSHSVFEPKEMVPDNKELFGRILQAFRDRYEFDLPKLLTNEPIEANQQ